MPTENGFSNQKKIGLSQYKTIHNVGSDKYAENVVTKGLIERQAISLLITAVDLSDDHKTVTIEIVGHEAKRAGEVLRFYTGGLADVELDIVNVLDADILEVLNVMDVIPQVGDEVRIAYYRTPQFDNNGNIVVSNGPIQFNLENVPTEVNEDNTFPINNTPLPTGMYIKKEGINVPVSDSVTPANVVAVPVKIMAAGGTDINITAGDINIQTTDMGANFDSMRVGDGSGNYIGVNADQEALTHDADAIAELAAANSTLDTIAAIDFATEAKQDDTNTALAALLTELQLKADLSETQPVSIAAMPLPAGGATEAKQDVGNGSLATIATKDFATEVTQAAGNVLIGPVTEVAPATDTASSGLNGRLQRIAQRITSLIGLLPASIGQKANAASLAVSLSTEQQVILSSLDTKLSTLITSNAVRLLTSVTNVAVSNISVGAPVGAKGFIIQNSTQAAGGLRFTPQGGGASATVGYYLGVGQSTSYIDGASNLALFDVDGGGFDAAILWFI